MHFQPLRVDDVAAAQRVAATLFPWENEHQIALAAAANPAGHASFFAAQRLDSVRCWTTHLADGQVSGLATLYRYRARLDEAWLAWFGLLPEVRGHGAGARLLDRIIAQMRNDGRRTLRLWTTDEPEYAAATGLYLRRRFVAEDYPALPGEDWRTLVFSLGLDGRPAIPWSAVLDRGELCGRQVPDHAAVAA